MSGHTPTSTTRLAFALGATVITLVAPAQRVHAQATLDRTVPPKAGASPQLHVPTWTKTRLANGAQLIVIQKHDLPLVAFSIDFVGGAANFESANKLGLASFTAQMLSEGTPTRNADQLSDAQQMLGTAITANVGTESGNVRFTALKDKFQPALALLADMMLNSTFPDSALERLRGRALVTLAQQKDQPNSIAQNVFLRVSYGDDHPYGYVVSERTVKAVTRADIVAFHKAYFRPGRAVITVSGDVDPQHIKVMVENALKAWPAGGQRPSFRYPSPPPPRQRTIYLIDKPKAAQSVFSFGTPGPARNTPDFYSLTVMNHILGGLFQSRLNHDIREVKGFSYGVRSSFAFGHGPGAFIAGGGIVSDKSDSALMGFMTHFKGVRGDTPFTDDEIKEGKQSLIQSLPGRFETVNGIGTAISTIYTQDLPESYYKEYAERINAVTKADLVRVARKYVDVDHMNMVIVGDRAAIEPSLIKTGIAPIVRLDVDGRPILQP